ncbi:hypothetical protein OO17_17590 [Rhodopseudomonas palustris]|uniref:Uncharacterized protein n=1 Tax=Rhodopseudomonas palustris TaxID=1076 RepID=A0A0D7EIJ1_RHOPL|nr:hypothetical protein OO17_17590 [Rhodopseudomonas palustris]
MSRAPSALAAPLQQNRHADPFRQRRRIVDHLRRRLLAFRQTRIGLLARRQRRKRAGADQQGEARKECVGVDQFGNAQHLRQCLRPRAPRFGRALGAEPAA